MCREGKYNMRIKDNIFTSYKTHNYCCTCELWLSKKDNPGIHCQYCGHRLRHRARYTKNKLVRYVE